MVLETLCMIFWKTRAFSPNNNLTGTVGVWGCFAANNSHCLNNYETYVNMLAENILPEIPLITCGDYLLQRTMRPKAFWRFLNHCLNLILLNCLTSQRWVPNLNSRKFCGTWWFDKYTKIVHISKRRTINSLHLSALEL